jgi:hypothetical protein
MTAAWRYPDGRPMRAGVRADGTYLNTVHGRTARAMDLQPEACREAVQLFADWSGRTATETDARRLAHLIGCGFPPSAAAAREMGYRLALACCPSRTVFRSLISQPIGM